jgi:membrane protease YdiL (CAAX protease family)
MDMMNQNRPGMTDRAGLFILIAFMGAGFVVGGGFSVVLWKVMTGQSILQMQTSMMNPAFVNEVRIMQTVLAAFIFLIPAIGAALILNKKPLTYLGFAQKNSPKTIGLGILVMAATVVLSGALATLTEMIPLSPGLTTYFKGLEDAYMKQVKVLSEMSGIPDLILSLIVMALAPAIFEEVFFRGGFQQMMTKATGNVLVSVVVTSLLFSAIHFSFYGFLSRTAMGIVLGFLFAKSGNLWIPILAHFFNNAVGVLQLYLLKMSGKNIEDGMDDKFPLFVLFFAVPAIFYLYKWFKNSIANDNTSLSDTPIKHSI